MKIDVDIERLGKDISYWNNVAPEGAECLIGGNRFVKWVDNIEFAYYPDEGASWDECENSYSLEKYHASPSSWKVIMKPAITEWNGEGQPPEGTRCIGVHLGYSSSFECAINGYWDGKVWFTDFTGVFDRDFVYPIEQVRFHQISTPEQIQRDELINAATKALEIKFGSPRSIYIAYCESLYDAGMLRGTDTLESKS